MKAHALIIVVLLGILREGLTQNPGLQFRLSQHGLSYAANKTIDIMEEKIYQQPIPKVEGTEKVLKVGKVEYSLNNMRISNFIKGSTAVDITDSGINLKMTDIGADILGDWRYKIKVLVPVRDSGRFELTVRGATMSLGVTVSMSSDGRPILQTTHCQASVSKLKIRFKKGASWLYNLFTSIIEKRMKKGMENILCKSIDSAIRGNIAEELSSIKVDFPIKDYGSLDYSLVAPPSFSGDSLESFHRGEFFWHADRTEAPFQPAPLPSSYKDLKMITVWLSDYVPNTIMHVLHTRGQLQRTVKAADLKEKDKELLAINCKTKFCIGSVFPESIINKYKDSSLEVEVESTERPDLVFSPDSITGKVFGKLAFHVRTPAGHRVFLFSARATLHVSLTASIDDNLIKFKATSVRPKLTPLEMGFEDDHFSVSSLSMLVNLATRAVVVPKINEIGAIGIAIPRSKQLKYVNPTLTIAENALIVMLDIQMKTSN